MTHPALLEPRSNKTNLPGVKNGNGVIPSGRTGQDDPYVDGHWKARANGHAVGQGLVEDAHQRQEARETKDHRGYIPEIVNLDEGVEAELSEGLRKILRPDAEAKQGEDVTDGDPIGSDARLHVNGAEGWVQVRD